MLSVYHWNDAVEETTEVLLMMKTTPERVEALTSRLAALHPYEVPEVLVTDASASDAYEAWVRREAGPR
jgi:periplasmic divalent cation tolerance protein